jgi:hypothetical protein
MLIENKVKKAYLKICPSLHFTLVLCVSKLARTATYLFSLKYSVILPKSSLPVFSSDFKYQKFLNYNTNTGKQTEVN